MKGGGRGPNETVGKREERENGAEVPVGADSSAAFGGSRVGQAGQQEGRQTDRHARL